MVCTFKMNQKFGNLKTICMFEYLKFFCITTLIAFTYRYWKHISTINLKNKTDGK